MDFLTKEKLDLVLTGKRVAACLPKRKRNTNKGSYGKAAIVAGSVEYTGAAYLSAAACLRSGVGYTTLFVPSEILPYYILRAPEILLKSTHDGGRYAFNAKMMKRVCGCDAVAYGMGMGVSEAVADGAAWLLRYYQGRLILDADGLNSLSVYKKEGFSALLKNAKCDVLLTPHVKEYSRMVTACGWEDNRACAAVQKFAAAHSVTILLKDYYSVITNGESVAVNSAGNSGQAKAGSGDVLSGVIVGLCAQGANGFGGGCAGAFLCGSAAELATEKVGEYSLTATDCIAHLGGAFLALKEHGIK